jgi:hypothetical protein
MAGYTIVNMNELENSAAGREARFARKHLDSEHLAVTRGGLVDGLMR